MTDNNKKIEVKFAPGVLEEMEASMSEEELQQFLEGLNKLVDDGSIEDFFAAGEEVDLQKLMIEDPELYNTLTTQLEGCFDESGEKPTYH